MSRLLSLVSRVSTVSGGGAVPVVVLRAMELPVGGSAGPRVHAETHARARAQAAQATRTAVSRGRDGRRPVARGLRVDLQDPLQRTPGMIMERVIWVGQREVVLPGKPLT